MELKNPLKRLYRTGDTNMSQKNDGSDLLFSFINFANMEDSFIENV